MKLPETASEVQLTSHVKGFLKKIGKSKNGKPKQFWLGRDEASAKVRALELMQKWENRPDGVEDWDTLEQHEKANERQQEQTKLATAMRERWLQQQSESDAHIKRVEDHNRRYPPPVAPWLLNSKETVKTGPTIIDAKNMYLESLRKRVGLIGSLGITEWTYNQTEHKLERALGVLNQDLTHLSELNYSELETFIYKLAARPNKKPNPLANKEVQKKQAGSKVSQRTVLGWIQEIKSFLLWSVNEGLYILPPHATNLWKIRPEAEEQKYRIISQEELRILWEGCINEKARTGDKGERRRLWIMLGLNCGFYAIDISTLLPEHITDDGFIWKLRRKTRKTNVKLIRTKWKLWKETQELLKKYMPLKVTPNQIRLSWERLTKATQLKVNHSNCRDTGSQFMEKLGGRELADTYCAHSRKGVIDSYSHPDWDTLNNALDRFYNEFVKPAVAAHQQEPKQQSK